jgi:hypothetical protein
MSPEIKVRDGLSPDTNAVIQQYVRKSSQSPSIRSNVSGNHSNTGKIKLAKPIGKSNVASVLSSQKSAKQSLVPTTGSSARALFIKQSHSNAEVIFNKVPVTSKASAKGINSIQFVNEKNQQKPKHYHHGRKSNAVTSTAQISLAKHIKSPIDNS